jgi:hypothetical protein
MATYVPGSETYLPNLEPFTPDYKFLSAVLDVRQDKYNTNWKATNDIYNKVVYADLSRNDTIEQRNQYIENLAPSLEKIANLDLSLAQNVDAAKGVFAPFFEDDLVVRDMVYTANYRKQMDYANRLMMSPNREQSTKYWDVGVRSLQYKMEDFINGTADQALNAPALRYVEDANLFELAGQILSELDPPLSMKLDKPARFPNTMDSEGNVVQGAIDPNWIITQQNGDLVTGAALQHIQMTLQNDPRVQQAYETEAYVASRDRAAQGISSGEFSSVEQGQQVWATETINMLMDQNVINQIETEQQLAKQEETNNNWNNYAQNNGVIPGSDDDILMQENMSSYEATKAALENQNRIQEIAQTPVSNTADTLNLAYQLLMHSNMQNDMIAAAQNFSMRDYEYTMKENKFALQEKKHLYDLDMERARDTNRKNNILLKGQVDRNNAFAIADAKGELVGSNDTDDPLRDALSGPTFSIGDSSTLDYTVDEDGNLDPNVDVMAESRSQWREADTQVAREKAQYIADALYQIHPHGENDRQDYSITIDGSEFTGTIDQIRTRLLEEDEGGNLINRSAIEQLFTEKADAITNLRVSNPGAATGQDYQNLYDLANGTYSLSSRQIVADRNLQTSNEVNKATYDLTRLTTRDNDPNIAALMDEGGFPDIFDPTSSVSAMLSRDEYVANAIKLVEAGEIVNIDQSWVNDTGTNHPNYFIVETAQGWDGEAIEDNATVYIDDAGNKSTNPRELTGGNVRKSITLDKDAITAEAGKVYDKLYENFNAALTDAEGTYRVSTFNTVSRGLGNTPGDLLVGVGYKGAVDPKAPQAEGNVMTADLIKQIRYLSSKGKNPMYIEGSLNDLEGKLKDQTSDQGEKVLQMYINDLRSYVNNPKSPNSPSPSPRATIEYFPVYGAPGEGKKSTAGYKITFNPDWLASKVKGGNDSAKQYGSITSDQFDKLNKGVSIVFDKDLDISPRSKAKSQMYSSPIVSEIMASENGFIERTRIDEDSVKIGTYRFVQTSPQEYNVNWRFREYQTGGTYNTSALTSMKVSTIGQQPGFLEKIEKEVIDLFDQQGAKNFRAKQKDVATYRTN